MTSNVFSNFFAEEAKKACNTRAEELNKKFQELEKRIKEVPNASRREELLSRFYIYKQNKEQEVSSTSSYSNMVTCFAEAINSLFNAFGIEINNLYNFYNVLTPNQYGYLINMFDKSVENENRRFIGVALHKIVDGMDLYKSNLSSLFDEFINYTVKKEKLDKSGMLDKIKLEDITDECVVKNLSEIEKKASVADIDVLINVIKEKYLSKNEQEFKTSQIECLFDEEDIKEFGKPDAPKKEAYKNPEAEKLILKLLSIRNDKQHFDNQNTIRGLVDYLIKNKKITMISPNFAPVAVGEGYDYKRTSKDKSNENELKNTFSAFYDELKRKFFPRYDEEVNEDEDENKKIKKKKKNDNDRILIEDALNSLFLLDYEEFNMLSNELSDIKTNNKIKNKFLAVTMDDKQGHEYLLSIFSKLDETGSLDICDNCERPETCIDKSLCLDYIEAGKTVYKKNKYDIVKMMVELKDMDSFNIKMMFPLLVHLASTSNIILNDFGIKYATDSNYNNLTRIEALKQYLRAKHWNMK